MPEGIEKRGKSSWSVRVYLGYDSRTKKRKYVRVTIRGSYRDAQRVRAELLRKRDEGRLRAPPGAARLTVGEFLRRWLAGREGELAPRTVAGQRNIIERYLAPVIGHLRLREVAPSDVQEVILRAREKGAQQGTIRNVHSVLRRAFREAVEMGLMADNPCDRARPGRYRPRQPQLPPLEQLVELLRVADGTPVGPMVRLAAATGMREGELLGLKWGDVDEERGVLRVQRSLSVVGGQAHERPAKARSARTVPLSEMALAALREQRERWRELCGREPGAGDYVFARDDGEPRSPRWAQYHFARVTAAAGLTGLRFHDLRHMVASLLLSRGANVRAVAEVLGHRVPSTTLDVYSHVLMGGAQQVVALLDDLLLGREGRGQTG